MSKDKAYNTITNISCHCRVPLAHPKSKFQRDSRKTQNIITWKHLFKQIHHTFSYLSTKEPSELKHVSYREINLCTPMSNRFAAREQSQPVMAVYLHAVVTGEMLLRQEPFQVLEQMVVSGSKIRSISERVKHVPVELLRQLLCENGRGRGEVSQRLPFIPSPKKVKQHSP
ncbi:hypothetical protein AVEN_258007-1 [Araneus ventricosus]|uniref:Uncharacterized protein n=1 Tax=Araneus ventricosus TaxID=182803 RepID=A0A4Y2Q3G4_ARAVE|nr:hypothetical protein AVEN_258007-1 [Araneus ventricosus]